MEIWKNIPGHPGYAVSDTGRVRSQRMVLKPFVVKSTGYMQVNLSKRSRHFVHRLVAAAFCAPRGDVVNHLNGDKADNRAENLEWTTQRENNIHKHRVLGVDGSCIGRFGGAHPKSIPVVATCIATGEATFFASGTEASRAKGFTSTGIAACCKGKNAHHAGYLFRYATAEDLAQWAPAERRAAA